MPNDCLTNDFLKKIYIYILVFSQNEFKGGVRETVEWMKDGVPHHSV